LYIFYSYQNYFGNTINELQVEFLHFMYSVLCGAESNKHKPNTIQLLKMTFIENYWNISEAGQ